MRRGEPMVNYLGFIEMRRVLREAAEAQSKREAAPMSPAMVLAWVADTVCSALYNSYTNIVPRRPYVPAAPPVAPPAAPPVRYGPPASAAKVAEAWASTAISGSFAMFAIASAASRI